MKRRQPVDKIFLPVPRPQVGGLLLRFVAYKYRDEFVRYCFDVFKEKNDGRYWVRFKNVVESELENGISNSPEALSQRSRSNNVKSWMSVEELKSLTAAAIERGDLEEAKRLLSSHTDVIVDTPIDEDALIEQTRKGRYKL